MVVLCTASRKCPTQVCIIGSFGIATHAGLPTCRLVIMADAWLQQVFLGQSLFMSQGTLQPTVSK